MAYRDATIPAPGIWRVARPARARQRFFGGDFAILAFVFIFYVNLAVVATRFHDVPQIVASSIALLLLLPLVRHVVFERQPLVMTPVLSLFFAFLGAVFLAAALSSEPEVAGRFVVTYLTEGLLLYLLVSNAVRGARTLNRVVWVLILAGSFMGAISLYQEFTHTYANDYGGLAQVDKFGFGQEGGFNISGDEEEEILRPRLGGPLGSENRYAQILAVVLPLALIKVFREPSRRLRLAATGASLLIAGGLLLTFSRGAAVAVAATLLFMVLLREFRIRHFLALLAVATAVVAFAVPDYVIRLSSLETVTAFRSGPAEVSDGAILGRATENLAAWNTFLDHPLTGVGPGAYFREYSREYANRLGLRYLNNERRGHSLYLELAADMGAIGLATFLAMVATAMVLLYRSSRYWRSRDPMRASLASGFFFALFAYLATGAFLQLSYQRYFWVILALASSVIWTLRQEQRAEALEGAPAPRLARNEA
ncbi:MAG: O-antigen ligase family protein [Gaiellaceae bacterium]